MKKACMRWVMTDNGYECDEKHIVANNINSTKYLTEMIENFNQSLRTHESVRKILKIWEEPVTEEENKCDY